MYKVQCSHDVVDKSFLFRPQIAQILIKYVILIFLYVHKIEWQSYPIVTTFIKGF